MYKVVEVNLGIYLSSLFSSSMECCIEILGLGTGMAEADVEDADDDECVEGESCLRYNKSVIDVTPNILYIDSPFVNFFLKY